MYRALAGGCLNRCSGLIYRWCFSLGCVVRMRVVGYCLALTWLLCGGIRGKSRNLRRHEAEANHLVGIGVVRAGVGQPKDRLAVLRAFSSGGETARRWRIGLAPTGWGGMFPAEWFCDSKNAGAGGMCRGGRIRPGVGVALGVAVLGRSWRLFAVTVDTVVMALRTLPPFLVALALAVFLRGPGTGVGGCVAGA